MYPNPNNPNPNSNSSQPHHRATANTNLTRYGSAPSSVFESSDVIHSSQSNGFAGPMSSSSRGGGGGGGVSSNLTMSLAGAGGVASGSNPMQMPNSGGLVRHSSSPAGFLQQLATSAADSGNGSPSSPGFRNGSVLTHEFPRNQPDKMWSPSPHVNGSLKLFADSVEDNVALSVQPLSPTPSLVSSKLRNNPDQFENGSKAGPTSSYRLFGIDLNHNPAPPPTVQNSHNATPLSARSRTKERRTRISGKLKKLQELVPNMDKQTSYSEMLDLAIQHIAGLQFQIQSMEIWGCPSIFCLLPTNYEFEKDTLVQLWMAMGCIKDETVGQAHFHSLLNGQYLLHSGSNFVSRKARYRMNKTKINDLLASQRDINGRFYLKWENESQRNITNTTKIQHASLMCNDIDASTFQTLQQFTELSTLLFLHNYGNKVTQVPDSLFLSCQKLKALSLSGAHIKKLSSFVGILNHLRYLDLSRTLIEWLPDTICSLGELQTLKLKGCVKLRGLPRKLKKLTKLRHLDVDVLRQLATLPGEIGALVSLQTLSAFLVGTEDGRKIQELKELNSITGDFCIAMLENVGNGDEAKEASLDHKQYLNKLELRWTASQLLRTNNSCYDVLNSLRPCASLKELQIFCYEGSTFPDWVSDPTFNQLVSVTFFKCEHISELPLIEQLPFLKHLELVKMNGVKKIERRGESEQAAFSRLEKLVVDEMQSLRSWNWIKTNEDDFKSLAELTINDCPGLREFHVFPCLSSLKQFEVKGCPKLESLSETKLPHTLVDLLVEDCPLIKRKCSQQGGEDWQKIQHVANIRICEEDVDDDEC